MSSNHTRVSRREWTEMQARVADTDAYIINRAEEARRIRDEANRRSREIAAAHEENLRVINQAVEALSNAYRNTLEDMGGAFDARIDAQSAEFRDQFREILNDVQTVSGRISRADRRVDELAGRYNDTFQALLARESREEDRARLTLQELDRLLEQIRPLNPGQFMAGEYAALQTLRTTAEANIRSGDYQAATLVTQNSILTASRLLTQLTLANESYNRQLTEARNEAAVVANRVEELASGDGVLSVEIGDQQQEYDYDIAYWSRGGFDAIRERLNAADARLAEGNLSVQELARTRNEIAQLQTQLEQCDRQARAAMAGSVFVEDTALRLHNCLTERGWELVEGGHHEDEAKEPYALQYEDSVGNTVSVVVSPGEETDKPIYAIEVFSDDPFSAGIIKEGIHSAVEWEGLQIEGIERRNDCHLNPTPEIFRENMIQEAQHRRLQQ